LFVYHTNNGERIQQECGRANAHNFEPEILRSIRVALLDGASFQATEFRRRAAAAR
jgi:hypothetical protein